MLVLLTIAFYFFLLFAVSRLVGRKSDNDAFFRGNRQSPWPMVAFGMIGTSISGITFIGVPGWAMSIDMTYMQMCLGFFFGYLAVAFVLLPVYYRYNLTSIYTYLERRFGSTSYKTGASFFILSKLLGSAAKFYVVCEVLQLCVGDACSIPYAATAAITLLMIWLYTRRSGIKALVWTDTLQTLCLIVALVLILLRVSELLGLSVGDAMAAVMNSPHSKMFEFGDWTSRQHFVKQFLSGVFVVIVMTGLDQDMMQKNLTCKNLRAAQKDMCSYGVMFIPVNFLFLALGVMLILLHGHLGLPLPQSGDELLVNVILDGTLGRACLVFFTIGVIASAFSSADSALTALTTTFTIDILRKGDDKLTRERVHIGMMLAFVLVTLAFHEIGSGSVMDLIYTLVSYTYGPLLGLFAFGLATRMRSNERAVPFVAVASPLICYAIDYAALHCAGYKFGYEMLMLNGLITFAGLTLFKEKKSRNIKLEI